MAKLFRIFFPLLKISDQFYLDLGSRRDLHVHVQALIPKSINVPWPALDVQALSGQIDVNLQGGTCIVQ